MLPGVSRSRHGVSRSRKRSAITAGWGRQYSTKYPPGPKQEPWHWAVGHHFDESTWWGEVEEGERQNGVWAGERGGSGGGESVEEQANMNGQLATGDQGHIWAQA